MRSSRYPLARRLAVVLALALALPALPVVATPLPAVVEPLLRTAPLGVGHTAQELLDGVQLVGVTWDAGDPQVAVRWRTPRGWTAWEPVEQDSGSVDVEDRAGTRPGTAPVFRPRDAVAVAVQLAGEVRGAELVQVGDGEVRGGVALGLPAARAAVQHGALGTVHTRADWGADERLRRGSPSYASRVEAVVVHHTAGSNDYRPEDVPARIRADYAYHVRSRGWSDLGYNLVLDKWGRIWEGRAGGLGRATVGTHAAGFNTGTLGVSVLGDYTRATPGNALLTSLARVSAYAAQTWRWDPGSSVTLRSGGSPRFPKGQVVTLPRVHGHGDNGRTACPGTIADRLPVVRDRARVLLAGPPAVTALTTAGSPVHAPAPFSLDARLSRDAWWAVVVHDAVGREVARTGGRSAAPSLRWDGLSGGVPLPAPPGRYTWTLEVDDGIFPVVRRSGPLDVGTPVVPLG
ncbi:MAG TPA: N-acetylmuramoyl-L-alanine amidase [Mycobacteriales bacterium]|nr:N-acetylmuramoyl-L-alanine amidase [Mycobacteriales bacterium]